MSPPPSYTNGLLVRRLLLLGWAHRGPCLAVLGYQGLLLALGLAGLGLTGQAVDILRHELDPGAPAPSWPFGLQPQAKGPMTLIVLAGGLVLAMAAGRALLNFRYAVAVGQLVQGRIVPELRGAVYDKLQRMSFRFFDATASGSIINRVTGDVQSVRAFVDQVLIQSVILLLSLAVYLVYMLDKSAVLTAGCLATTPLLWVATTAFSRWVQPAYARSRQRADELVTFFAETVQGIRVIKGFAGEAERRRAFEQANRALRSEQTNIFRRVSLFSPSVDLVSQANLVVLMVLGGSLVARRTLTLGDLLVFAGLLQQFAGQVANLGNIVNTLQQSLISARRVFEVLDAPLEVQSPPAALRPPETRGHVRFEAVEFAYAAGRPALAGIDLDVAPGQRVALFGETGAGKSTLLALVPRFYDPTAGRVLIDGIDVALLDLDLLRARVGIVFQESFLFSVSIAENIRFGRPEATRQEVETAARLARVHDLVASLPDGYDTVLEEGGANLSGGQRQRIALARAILRDPPILLLDDPTAAVDAQTEREIMDALERVSERRTTFIATHRLGPCLTADLVLVLEGGRIVERGRHEELLAAAGRYARAVALQTGTGDAG